MIVIAGPCVLENYETALTIAKEVSGICKNIGVGYVFKASWRKENRSLLESYNGVTLGRGLDMLERIRQEVGCEVTTDFHTAQQVQDAFYNRDPVDVIQIPALLSRQTDLLFAASCTGKIVNLKKGQFMSVGDVRNALGKLKDAHEVWVTERGNSFGYGQVVVDMLNIPEIQGLGTKCIVDCTHPLAGRGISTFKGALCLVDAAIGAGADGVFIECHPDPSKAKCDGKTSVPLSSMEALLNFKMSYGFYR